MSTPNCELIVDYFRIITQMDLLDPIPADVYRACLLHTMEYRLAPWWNKVGLYLVEGQNFLSSTGSVNAIMLNIKEIRGKKSSRSVNSDVKHSVHFYDTK